MLSVLHKYYYVCVCVFSAHHRVGLTASNLSRELESVVEWKKLGVALDIPTSEMEKMVRNYPRGEIV